MLVTQSMKQKSQLLAKLLIILSNLKLIKMSFSQSVRSAFLFYPVFYPETLIYCQTSITASLPHYNILFKLEKVALHNSFNHKSHISQAVGFFFFLSEKNGKKCHFVCYSGHEDGGNHGKRCYHHRRRRRCQRIEGYQTNELHQPDTINNTKVRDQSTIDGNVD